MGLFGKIKNILFEDEEEVEETMPVFTKDEVKPSKKEENVVSEKEEPIKFNKPNIIRYSIGALAIIIATSASGATIASCKAKNNSYDNNALGFKIDVEKEFGDAITDYPYDPASVKFSKANNPWAKKTTGEIEKAVGTNRSERSDNDRFIV